MMPTVYTYRFATHWTTTSDELTGYIERFEVTPDQVVAIEHGVNPDEALEITDPYVPSEPTEEVTEEILV